MAIDLSIILLIVFIHFIADFVFQSDKVAINKSSNNLILLKHCTLYAAPFLIFGIAYALINFVLHFVTDYVSSRATSKLWQAGERHWFFVVVGADQALHMIALFTTYALLFGK